jgi:head-tail adaptor
MRFPETGSLMHRVSVQTSTTTKNASNEDVPAWSTVSNGARRAARVEGRGGREVQRANQSVPEATHRVTFRADSLTRSLTPQHQLVWHDGQTDRELGVVDVDTSMAQERGEVYCLCEEAR